MIVCWYAWHDNRRYRMVRLSEGGRSGDGGLGWGDGEEEEKIPRQGALPRPISRPPMPERTGSIDGKDGDGHPRRLRDGSAVSEVLRGLGLPSGRGRARRSESIPACSPLAGRRRGRTWASKREQARTRRTKGDRCCVVLDIGIVIIIIMMIVISEDDLSRTIVIFRSMRDRAQERKRVPWEAFFRRTFTDGGSGE